MPGQVTNTIQLHPGYGGSSLSTAPPLSSALHCFHNPSRVQSFMSSLPPFMKRKPWTQVTTWVARLPLLSVRLSRGTQLQGKGKKSHGEKKRKHHMLGFLTHEAGKWPCLSSSRYLPIISYCLPFCKKRSGPHLTDFFRMISYEIILHLKTNQS